MIRREAGVTLGVLAGLIMGVAVGRWLLPQTLPGTSPYSSGSDNDLLRELALIRNEISSLQREVDLGQSAPSDVAPVESIAVVRSRAVEVDAGKASEQISVERRITLLWRCLRHDVDGVVAVIDSHRRSPFEPAVIELVESAFDQLEDLRARLPVDIAVEEARRIASTDLANRIALGALTPDDDRSRVLRQLEDLSQPADPRFPEFIRCRQSILRDLASSLSALPPR